MDWQHTGRHVPLICRPEDTKAGLLRLRVLAQLASFQRNAPQLLNREEAQTCISALLTAVTDKRTASELAQEAALGIAQISGEQWLC